MISATHIGHLNFTWHNFKEIVAQDPYDPSNTRVELLNKCQKLIKNKKFKDLDYEERKLFAGINNKLPFDSGWFGSLNGAGVMRKIVKDYPEIISDALDLIPMDGKITESDYLNYVDKFLTVCDEYQVARKPKIATISRFLAMKRPDVFVAINKKNKKKLRENLNIDKPIEIENYWHDVIKSLQQLIWWNTSIMQDQNDYLLWQYRAAMLDAIYYEH